MHFGSDRSPTGLGGCHGYGVSSAAFNNPVQNLTIEEARRNARATIIGLRPGTLDAALS